MSATNSQLIMSELSQFINQDNRNDQEKQWLLDHSQNEAQKQTLQQLQTTDLELLGLLDKHSDLRIKQLPDLLFVSQPTISRIVTKLAHDGLLEKFRTAKNDKDIWVKLTPSGSGIASLHARLDAQIAANVNTLLQQYSATEIEHFTALLHQIRTMTL